jgi:ribose 5-phosphate isomerase B
MASMVRMKVYVASDHAGFDLKSVLIQHITELGHEIEDTGTLMPDPEDDYPDFIIPCAKKVASEDGSCGIILGGSGQGEAMAANRQKGIRAAEFYGGDMDIVRLAREHNNANILSLGARFVSEIEAKKAVEILLKTAFSEAPRHARRLAKF